MDSKQSWHMLEKYLLMLVCQTHEPRPYIYTIGASSLLGILAAFLTVDILRRKTLLTASGLMMMVGSTLLGIHFYITRPSLCGPPSDSHGSDGYTSCNAPISIVSLIVYGFGFSVGFGPVSCVLVSELLPLSVRG